jgi:hypothetical protein
MKSVQILTRVCFDKIYKKFIEKGNMWLRKPLSSKRTFRLQKPTALHLSLDPDP